MKNVETIQSIMVTEWNDVPAKSVRCGDCKLHGAIYFIMQGTGLVVCGCVKLSAVDLDVLGVSA